ncbi:MAG: T9SS type A sorting domain-containing protein [Ferruginibacter sp.]
MKLLLSFILLISGFDLYAQTGLQYWKWVKSFGGNGDDIVSDIKTKNGYIYVTGTFTSSSIQWENTTLTNNGGRDIFIAKMDTAGNTIWVKNFGGSGDDSVQQLEMNSNSDFVLLCKSSGSNINIGSVSLTNPENFYTRFDANGDLINGSVLPGSLRYTDIDISSDGSVFVACLASHHAYSFANSYIDTLPRAMPPAGAPVMRDDPSQYSPGAMQPDYKYSGAVLKYDLQGAESWVKVFYGAGYLPMLGGDTVILKNGVKKSFQIEINSAENSLVVMSKGLALDVDSVYYDPIPHGYYENNFIFTFSGSGPGHLLQNFQMLNLDQYGVLGFTMGDTGPAYLSYQTFFDIPSSEPQPTMFMAAVKNGKFIASRAFSGQPAYNTDKGGPMVKDNVYDNYFTALDSSLNLQDKIQVPNGEKMNEAKICMAGNAVYFGDNFTDNPLIISNNNYPSLPDINLPNQGLNDIFIGRFYTQGYMPLQLNNFKDTIQFCSGISNINLDSSILKYNGAGNPTYHWEPAINFVTPDKLNTSVLMTADTIIATLTVTDAAGDHVAKQVVFFNGILPNLHLKLVDTATCSNNFIKLAIEGNKFIDCYAFSRCDQRTVKFDSLNHIIQMWSADCPNANYYQLRSDAPGYCVDTTSHRLTIYPAYNFYKPVYVCPGSNYTIPGDTTYTNITENTRRINYAHTSNGCDSTVITDMVLIHDPSTKTENVKLCRGSAYTFPDSTTLNDIQADITHKSTIHAAGGCDSLYVNTTITIIPYYEQHQAWIICAGQDYTFPDGTVITNIQRDTNYTSHFISVSGCDSLIISEILVSAGPAEVSQQIAVCPGSSYTFPDNTTITNILDNTDHTSVFPRAPWCDSIIITHLRIGTVSSQTENITVCAGSSYTFPDNSILNNIQNNTGHTSTLTSNSGCDSIITTNLTVIKIDTAVTKTKRTLQADINNAGYQWMNCSTGNVIAGEMSQTFTASQVGIYAVKLEKDGCTDTSSCYEIVLEDFLSGRPAINTYPVPVKNILTTSVLSETQAEVQVVLYNSFGKNVYTRKNILMPGENKININVSAFPPGLYTLELIFKDKNEKITRRVIIG